ncbi:hypothetical protein K431DRAFT_304579 [Polychaeton citri CBS 116435]|uniref:Mitochondrial protein n=1 Tax=Polychaeton citri CBS 116435 TaxID=1314669 RepID=A0A9P4Q436_9PEZI|nr:hypothetical protein K431DRAFT_304579 [Polychaeton citri CBS 116435]
MTMNSPDSLLQLYNLASKPEHGASDQQPLYTAELMREVGLKCIGFNGVPRTINCLGAFYAGLPHDVQSALGSRRPRRNLDAANIDAALQRGRQLWDSIYHPFTSKLTAKLAQSHPDLPVHIVESEYGCLFSDPPLESAVAPHPTPSVGRVLTSVVAVACLRSQTGVGPQVVSHVFGLRKAFEDGSAEGEDEVQGARWLAGDEGSMWLLDVTDRIVQSIGQAQGTTFAPGMPERAKL